MYGDLKLTFIQMALRQYMQDVIAAMKREIIRRNVRVTDELLTSLSYNVYQQDAGGAGGLSFAEWGRYIDMGVGRGHPIGGIAATADALKAKKEPQVRKPVKIYSPIAYGQLNGLIGELMYGFTEETKALIKKELDASIDSSKAAL